jgi:hypothetical protein
MPKTQDTAMKVVQAVEGVSGDQHLIALSSGVVLRGKAAPPLILIKVMSAFPRPKPPVYYSEVMGREVENPDDPDYLERVQAHGSENSNAVVSALILLGTELVELPKKFPGPNDDAWLEEYRELGLTPKPESKAWRYLNWVMFKAVLNKDDLLTIRDVVGRLSGVPEAEVAAAESFPGRNQKPG